MFPLGGVPPSWYSSSIMQSEKLLADNDTDLLKWNNDTGQENTCQATHVAAVSDHTSQHPPIVNESPGGAREQVIDLTVQLSEEEDEDTESWTQIPGPAEEDMSDSDESSFDTAVQYQIPTAVQKAEEDTTHHLSGLHTVSDVHRRYQAFALLLCKETTTEDACQRVLEGLSIAIDTARSIRLDKDTVDDEELDIHAFALVIHIWQIACLRMQHGIMPPEETEVSLCLHWTAYFLSAFTIVQASRKVSFERLRYAVQYWEDRLRSMGGGNQWMEDTWAKGIPHIDPETVVHRNQTADLYLEALEQYGKEGVTISIIEEEKKGDCTQLRTMTQQSPDAMKNARRQIASMLYSMDTSLLKALIQGQLPRLAEMESGAVHEALRKINEQDYIQPGTYLNCICDYAGLSPTPEQWRRVCEQMLDYVQYGDQHNDLAEQIDQQIHPKENWPKDLAHKGFRRYTEWRSYTENGSYLPDSIHRRWVKYFVDQLKKRMEGQPIHAPLSVPVVEIGFSNDPHKRLKQHRHHESSNYLMNLAEAVFAIEYPHSFRLQQNVVFSCYRPIQTWLSEIVITQLAQGYVEGGGGFSHEPAGRSNTSSNKKVPAKIWTRFEAEIYADGTFEAEVKANRQRVQALEQAGEQLEQEAEHARRIHAARVTHLNDLIALEEARKDLYDHLRGRRS